MALKDNLQIKVPEGMGTDGGSIVNVEDYVAEVKGFVRQNWEKRHKQCRINEEYYHGNQWVSIDDDFQVAEHFGDLHPEEYEAYTRNYMAGIVDARTAMLLENAPAVRCWPNAAYGLDPALAEFCTSLLLWVYDQNELSESTHHVVHEGNLYGRAGWQIVWDNDIGPRNPANPEDRGGGVDFREINPFSFGSDGSDKEEDELWCGFRSLVDEFQAKKMLLDAGATQDEITQIQVVHQDDGDDSEKTFRGVEVWEFWHKTSARFPDGLRIVEIGGKVAAATPFPYEHGMLPRATFFQRPKRGSSNGTSWLDDAVIVQHQHNTAITVKMRRIMALRKLYVMAPERVTKQLDDQGDRDINIITATDRDFLETKTIDDPKVDLFTQVEDETLRGLENVAGVPREAAFSSEVAQSAAGKTIAYLSRLHQMRYAGEMLRIMKMITSAGKQTIALYQEFAPDWLLISIVGEQYAYMVDHFREMDLDGMDVVFDITSGVQESPAGVSAAAEDRMMQGDQSPQTMNESAMGMAETPMEAAVRVIVVRQVEGVLNGQPPTSDTGVDPAMAVPIVEQLAAQNAEHPNGGAVWELLELYKQQVFNVHNQAQQMVNPTPAGPQDDFAPQPGQVVGPGGIPVG